MDAHSWGSILAFTAQPARNGPPLMVVVVVIDGTPSTCSNEPFCPIATAADKATYHRYQARADVVEVTVHFEADWEPTVTGIRQQVVGRRWPSRQTISAGPCAYPRERRSQNHGTVLLRYRQSFPGIPRLRTRLEILLRQPSAPTFCASGAHRPKSPRRSGSRKPYQPTPRSEFPSGLLADQVERLYNGCVTCSLRQPRRNCCRFSQPGML